MIFLEVDVRVGLFFSSTNKKEYDDKKNAGTDTPSCSMNKKLNSITVQNDQLKQEVKDLKKEQEKQKKQIDEHGIKIQHTESKVRNHEARIQKNEEDIGRHNQRINKTEDAISEIGNFTKDLSTILKSFKCETDNLKEKTGDLESKIDNTKKLLSQSQIINQRKEKMPVYKNEMFKSPSISQKLPVGGIKVKIKDNDYQAHNTQNSSDSTGSTFSQTDIHEDAAPIPIMSKSNNKNQNI